MDYSVTSKRYYRPKLDSPKISINSKHDYLLQKLMERNPQQNTVKNIYSNFMKRRFEGAKDNLGGEIQ